MEDQSDINIQYINSKVDDTSDYVAKMQVPEEPLYEISLENTEFSYNSARKLYMTTSHIEAKGSKLTIIGTNIYDEPIQEILSPSSTEPGEVYGKLYFKTITSSRATGTASKAFWNGLVSIGMTSTIIQSIGDNKKTYIKGYSITSGPLKGIMKFCDRTSLLEPVKFKLQIDGSKNKIISYTIPGEGLMFEKGLTIEYTNKNITSMNIYYT